MTCLLFCVLKRRNSTTAGFRMTQWSSLRRGSALHLVGRGLGPAERQRDADQ